jgi:hypothetical protein
MTLGPIFVRDRHQETVAGARPGRSFQSWLREAVKTLDRDWSLLPQSPILLSSPMKSLLGPGSIPGGNAGAPTVAAAGLERASSQEGWNGGGGGSSALLPIPCLPILASALPSQSAAASSHLSFPIQCRGVERDGGDPCGASGGGLALPRA